MEIIRKENVGNFDDVNIASVENSIQAEFQDLSRDKRAFTMLQRNSSCLVEVTQSSREKCAAMLLN